MWYLSDSVQVSVNVGRNIRCVLMTDSSSKDISVRLPRRFLAKDALSKHNTPKRTVKQHV